MPPLPSFATRLKASMDARGLDAPALADAMHIHASAVYRLTSGARVPSVDTLAKLADALGWDSAMRGDMLTLAAKVKP